MFLLFLKGSALRGPGKGSFCTLPEEFVQLIAYNTSLKIGQSVMMNLYSLRLFGDLSLLDCNRGIYAPAFDDVHNQEVLKCGTCWAFSEAIRKGTWQNLHSDKAGENRYQN